MTTGNLITEFIRTTGYNDSNYLTRLEYMMPEETKQQPEWITFGQAVDRPECKVKSRTTLHNMVERGDIPDECLDQRPLGDGRTVTYIDANCLENLPYRGHGERGLGKRDD